MARKPQTPDDLVAKDGYVTFVSRDKEPVAFEFVGQLPFALPDGRLAWRVPSNADNDYLGERAKNHAHVQMQRMVVSTEHFDPTDDSHMKDGAKTPAAVKPATPIEALTPVDG